MSAIPLRSSVALVEVDAAHDVVDGNLPEGTVIPLISDHVVALVSTTPNEENSVKLPSGAPIGATVEVHRVNLSGFRVQAPSGENIEGVSQFDMADGAVIFRKITATRWGHIG